MNSPLSRGPHQLIRDGACLVETPSQILEALCLAKVEKTGHDPQVDKPARDGGILDFVDFAPTPINEIAQRSGLTIAKISAMLIRVELQGLVKTCAGGYIRLR